jgi:hypothetical protein
MKREIIRNDKKRIKTRLYRIIPQQIERDDVMLRKYACFFLGSPQLQVLEEPDCGTGKILEEQLVFQ